MDRKIGRLMRNMALSRMVGLDAGSITPATDIYETDDEIIIHMDVAGAPPEKLNVMAEQTSLTISGERQRPFSRVNCIHQLEVEYGHFERTVPLPEPVDVGLVSSTLTNGFLLVRLPKIKRCGKVRINIA